MEDLNVYLLIGVFPILAYFILLIKILHSRSAFGISGKSLILSGFLEFFWIIARYFNIFGSHISGSVYYSVLNVLYLLSITLLIVLIYRTFKDTYQKEFDTFSITLLIFTTAILAVFINYVVLGKGDNFWLYHNLMKVAWTFSIYIEAVAIVPQLFMIWKFENMDAFMKLYLIVMATYKGMYIGYWACKYRPLDDIIVVVEFVLEALVIVGILALTLAVSLKVCGQEERKMEMFIYNVKSDVNECTFMTKIKFNKNKNETKMDQVQVPVPPPPQLQVLDIGAFKVLMENECKKKTEQKI